MPATVSRVRMPADNRLSVSDSLKTTPIWQIIGHVPYEPEDQKKEVEDEAAISEKAKGLFALARLTGNSSSVTPGACRKMQTAWSFGASVPQPGGVEAERCGG
mmetsp:Transcript_35669/g.102476  ORF Transcript_35669/g.102476 Transcript_35669/m.102476 type:complete len:103 (+) Transcript_35669:89-397(+)